MPDEFHRVTTRFVTGFHMDGFHSALYSLPHRMKMPGLWIVGLVMLAACSTGRQQAPVDGAIGEPPGFCGASRYLRIRSPYQSPVAIYGYVGGSRELLGFANDGSTEIAVAPGAVPTGLHGTLDGRRVRVLRTLGVRGSRGLAVQYEWICK